MMLDNVASSLRANVQRLLDSRPDGENRQAFAKRIGVGDGTLGRIIAGEGNPQLDTIVALAAAARVKPWEMLMPLSNRLGEEPPPPYAPDTSALVEAIEQAESIIEDAGNPHLPPAARAAIISAVHRLKLNGVGMESARQIVSDLLANTSQGKNHGAGRTSKT